MEFKEELKVTLRTTSLKGIPRVLSSKDTVQKVVWALAVLCFLGVCIQQVYQAFSEYFSYQVNIVVKKDKLDFTAAEEHLFPTVILCNSNGLNANLTETDFKVLNSLSPLEYSRRLTNITTCPSCTPEEQFYLYVGAVYVNAKKAFNKNLQGLESFLGYDYFDIVIDCKVEIVVSTIKYTLPCQDHVNIEVKHILHPSYLNCYTFRPKISPYQIIEGIYLTVYLHNEYNGINNPLKDGVGAVVSLVPSGYAQTVDSNSILVAPGFSSAIPFQIHRTEKQPHPYSNCVNSLNVKFLQNIPHTYTKKLCMAECSRYLMAQICECNEVLGLDYPEIKTNDLYFCGYLINTTRQNLIDMSRCFYPSMGYIELECTKQCPQECIDIAYETQVSATRWPPALDIGDFYNTYIRNRGFQKRFAQYEPIYDAMLHGSADNFSLSEKREALNMIQENFATMHIYSGEKYFTRYVETPKVTLTAFGSQLGGILNLWAGITVVIIIEFIDFLYRLSVCRRKNQTSVNRITIESANNNKAFQK